MSAERDYVYCTGCWWCARPPLPSDTRCPNCGSPVVQYPPERGPLGIESSDQQGAWVIQGEILMVATERCCCVVRGISPYVSPSYSTYPLHLYDAMLAARQLAAEMAGRKRYRLLLTLRLFDVPADLPPGVRKEGSDG